MIVWYWISRYFKTILHSLGLLLLGLGWLVTPKAYAQAEIKFGVLEIDLRPEYDRPGVLVIYHITLSPDVSLPVDIKIRIPTEVGDPSAVAVQETDGGLFSIAYERVVNGDWSEILFTATMPQVQLEYYDPSLAQDKTAREFRYFWPGDYAIVALAVQVQQPVGASEMRITPDMGDGVRGSDGLIYFKTQAGSLEVGQTFELNLSYKKNNNELSTENLSVEPSTPVTNISSSQRTFLNMLPWILAALGIVLIVGAGVWWYWQTGVNRKSSKKAHRRRKLVIVQDETIPEGQIYCHHCGKRASPGDRFCRTCGAKIRG